MLRLVNDRRGRTPETRAGRCQLKRWNCERTEKGEAVRRRGGSRGGSTVLKYSEAVVVWEAEVDGGGRDKSGGWTMDGCGRDEGLQRHGEGGCGPGSKD